MTPEEVAALMAQLSELEGAVVNLGELMKAAVWLGVVVGVVGLFFLAVAAGRRLLA